MVLSLLDADLDEGVTAFAIWSIQGQVKVLAAVHQSLYSVTRQYAEPVR